MPELRGSHASRRHKRDMAILEYVGGIDGIATFKMIEAATSMSHYTVSVACRKLADEGYLKLTFANSSGGRNPRAVRITDAGTERILLG